MRGSLGVRHAIIRLGARRRLSLQIEQVPGSLSANSRCLWRGKFERLRMAGGQGHSPTKQTSGAGEEEEGWGLLLGLGEQSSECGWR